jgi:regulator of replication initiation timing
MEKTLQELKIIIREMILEIGELKERVTVLEREKQDLIKEAESSPPVNFTEWERIRIQGEGYEQLGSLYHEGYHICTMAFGQKREGECLFCIALMEKE